MRPDFIKAVTGIPAMFLFLFVIFKIILINENIMLAFQNDLISVRSFVENFSFAERS